MTYNDHNNNDNDHNNLPAMILLIPLSKGNNIFALLGY